MDEAECRARYGREATTRVRVENLSQDPADFVDLGVTPLGVPVFVSRRYLESDLSIAVGNIIPHMYAGWAGGAKMVQPGVSNRVTTAKTHLMAGPRVYEILGDVDNPVRQEMEQIARDSGLNFIVNVVLNRDGQVAAVVAGDLVTAHRALQERAARLADERARRAFLEGVPWNREIVRAYSERGHAAEGAGGGAGRGAGGL